LVRPEYASDEEYSKMFIDEAMVASAVHHPNVCETYDLGRDGDVLYMVLEWVPGDSLSGLMSVDGVPRPLPLGVGVRIVSDACAGLHAAHDAHGSDGHPLGIVHRDVSAPNILISTHGHVKVSDFGIAKARNQLHARTRTGQLKGKLGYVAPEQILGRALDRRTDVYGMGCVLYVATLAARPFGTGSAALPLIVHGRFEKPSDVDPRYPPALEAIVLKALSKDPVDRYQTADELRLALERFLLEANLMTTSADVADCVRRRLRPTRAELIAAIQNTGRIPSEAMFHDLLQPEDTNSIATGSGRAPRGSTRPSRSPRDARSAHGALDADEDATRIVERRNSMPVKRRSVHPAANRHADDEAHADRETWRPPPRRTQPSIAEGTTPHRSSRLLWAVGVLLLLALIASVGWWSS
jgi:serine/threonine-protein kinase